MKILKRASCAMAILLLAGTASAETVRFIVPYSAGGPTDLVARIIAPALGEALGQTVVVENKPGASGMLGITAVARADPDGTTIGMATRGTVLTELIQRKTVSYDMRKELRPIATVGQLPSVLVVNNDLGVKSLDDLRKLANERTLHYASSGMGNSPHLAGEILNRKLGTNMQHVPYAGAAPALVDVIAGNADMIVADIPAVRSPIEAGKVTAIATLMPKRAAILPDVPTDAEQGYPDLFTMSYYVLVAPAGMSDETLAKFETAMLHVLDDDAMIKRLADAGISGPLNSADSGALIDSEFDYWGPFVEEIGIVQK